MIGLIVAAMLISTPNMPTYDIPLTEELQKYTYELCQEKKVDYEMVLATMKVESDYRLDLISRTHDYGIMQINRINHKWLREDLGITDIMDPEQNILAGVTILSKLTSTHGSPHKIMMAYNMGETGAKKRWEAGIWATKYSQKVVNEMERLKKEKEM